MIRRAGETGSFLTMSPEVLRAQPYSAAADIFSLGAVAWELLARTPLASLTVPFQRARTSAGMPPLQGQCVTDHSPLSKQLDLCTRSLMSPDCAYPRPLHCLCTLPVLLPFTSHYLLPGSFHTSAPFSLQPHPLQPHPSAPAACPGTSAMQGS